MSFMAKRSLVWSHFEVKCENNIKVAVCNICKRQYSYKSATTTMKRHLELAHEILINEKKIPVSNKIQQRIQQFIPPSVKAYSTDSKRHIECSRAVAEYIIRDMQAFDTVTSQSFKNLTATLDPR